MKKTDGRPNILKTVIILVILALMLVAFYYYVANSMAADKVKEEAQISKVQKLLEHNLEQSYPPTPKEVVKFYSEITQCFYNETYSDQEMQELADQIQRLYDEELIANQSPEDYIKNLRDNIASMKENKYTISSYAPSSSTEVEYFDQDGSEWAKLYCIYNMRQGTKMVRTNQQFLLRKDSGGQWKIFGWKLVEE